MTPVSIDQNLWALEEQIPMPPGLKLPTRTHVIRLPDGGLLLLSPLPGLPAARAAIEALGEVRALVAHTSFHHLGLAAAVETWPRATLYGTPELAKKRADLRFQATLDGTPPALWEGVLDHHVIAGAPALSEVALFHRPTRTLILGDLTFNLSRPDDLRSRWMFRLTGSWGHFGPSRLIKAVIKDRKALARSLEALLAWEPRRVVMAHGHPVEDDVPAALKRAFAFLAR